MFVALASKNDPEPGSDKPANLYRPSPGCWPSLYPLSSHQQAVPGKGSWSTLSMIKGTQCPRASCSGHGRSSFRWCAGDLPGRRHRVAYYVRSCPRQVLAKTGMSTGCALLVGMSLVWPLWDTVRKSLKNLTLKSVWPQIPLLGIWRKLRH